MRVWRNATGSGRRNSRPNGQHQPVEIDRLFNEIIRARLHGIDHNAFAEALITMMGVFCSVLSSRIRLIISMPFIRGI